jgi:hypothetical protein
VARPTRSNLKAMGGTDKLLGNKIHAVMKAGEDAQARQAKELEYFVWPVMLHDKHDRASSPSVNLAGSALRFIL